MVRDAAARLLIADPSAIVRDGLSAAFAGLHAVSHAADAATLLAAVDRERPDVVLLDLGILEREGPGLVAAITRGSPASRVIVLSSLEDEVAIGAAFAAGAHAHLPKDAFREQLLAVVDCCLSRPAASTAVAAGLTAHELAILGRVARGATDLEIAAALGVSEGTLRISLEALLHKLGVEEPAQAAIAALKLGVLRL